MKTAVICAMRRELDAITAEMENVSVSRQRGFEIFTGELYGKRVAACLSGVGKAYAAAATAVLIERFSPEIIINSGVAGGAPGLKKGEVFIAERAAEHDYSVPDEPVRFFEADASRNAINRLLPTPVFRQDKRALSRPQRILFPLFQTAQAFVRFRTFPARAARIRGFFRENNNRRS